MMNDISIMNDISQKENSHYMRKFGLHNMKSVVYSCEIKRNYKKKQSQDM